MDECCRTVLNVLNQFEYLDVLIRLAHRQPHDHEATITPAIAAVVAWRSADISLLSAWVCFFPPIGARLARVLERAQ